MTTRDPSVACARMSVLVVEDDPRMLDILMRHIERMGYDARGAPGASHALQMMGEDAADAVLTDIRMPGMDGRMLLEVVRERFPNTKVVLMTAFGRVEDAVEAMRNGAYWYVCKPFKMDEVAVILRNVAREVSLEHQVAGLRKAVHGRWSADRLIGGSPVMREARALIREAAEVNATVLVTGRSGTGKEMAARAVHAEGPRADGPFIAVNCAAIPEALFESAMFGHRRGAFTGAVSNQTGFFEQAHGGTLFLDEVGDIPLSQQPKILRVLQDGELTPVGGARPVRVDLRIVCATNRDLEQLVRDGGFREDLFYRIHVLRIHMPALADRIGDIPALAEHLMLRIAEERGSAPPRLDDDAIEKLRQYAWPGNVRELRNVLERAMLAARGRPIAREDLAIRAAAAEPAPLRSDRAWVPATLADVEKTHVAAALDSCGWNRSEAARVLGIDRRTLFAKIQRYGLVGPLRPGPSRDEQAGRHANVQDDPTDD